MGDTIRLGLVILMQVPCVPLVTPLSSFAVKVPHKRSHTPLRLASCPGFIFRDSRVSVVAAGSRYREKSRAMGWPSSCDHLPLCGVCLADFVWWRSKQPNGSFEYTYTWTQMQPRPAWSIDSLTWRSSWSHTIYKSTRKSPD